MLIPWYGSINLQARGKVLSDREKRIEHLAFNVFSRGMQFMKSSPAFDFLPSYRQSYPEVSLVGPVNGGKSAILHAISGKSTIARVSKKTGNTGTIRFCCVGDAFLISDTVGYGHFTKGGYHSRSARLYAHAFVRQYIASRVNLQKVYFVLDVSRGVSCFTCRDKEYYAWLSAEKIPFTLVLSKIDKLQPMDLLEVYENIRKETKNIDRDLKTEEQRTFLEISSKTGHGIRRLMNDMVNSVTTNLKDSQLTIRQLQKISYTPMTTQQQLDIESKYHPILHNLPLSDETPYPHWILGSGISTADNRIPSTCRSFYSSIDKIRRKSLSESSCGRASIRPIIKKSNEILHGAIQGVYSRCRNHGDHRKTSESQKLPLPNLNNYLSSIHGTIEKYLIDYPIPSAQLEEGAFLKKSTIFEAKEKDSKSQMRKSLLKKGFLPWNKQKSTQVSSRIFFPFSRSSQEILGPARMIPSLKLVEHKNTFGMATLQRRK